MQMSRYILVFFLFVSLYSCRVTNSGDDTVNTEMIINKTNPDGTSAALAEISFDEKLFDFGKISQGEIVKYTFNFTNTGKEPLVLSSVKPSCGCTVPKDWPKHPIMPGESGQIDVELDSETQKSAITKSVMVVTNTNPSTHILTLQGEVLTPDYNK